MKLIIDGFQMYGDYTSAQIDLIHAETKKPSHQRKYVLGIDLSKVKKIEVIP